MTQDLLAVHQLRAGYGGTPILQGIDLTVGRGEIVAVIGRNGVGKTTLMKTLIGLIAVTRGEILFQDRDITTTTADRRARKGIGYIPQGREVFPRLTVRENLMMGALVATSQPTKLDGLVERYFPILRQRWEQKAGTMSGGEQQQLAIARALVGNPDLVLLDEPSEGIQPSIVKDIARNITRLNAEIGLTVLFVEQNIDMIRRMAQRCYVMDKGWIVAEVRPADLADPTTVRRYLAV